MNKKILVGVMVCAFVLPFFALAQSNTTYGDPSGGVPPTTLYVPTTPASSPGFFSNIGTGFSNAWTGVKNFFSSSPSNTTPPASAQNQSSNYQGGIGIGGLFTWFGNMLRLILPIIISIAIVWFIYEVFMFTVYSTDEGDKEKAKGQMIWGIIGIFVMVSVWGLVNILQSTFSLNNSVIRAPGIQTQIQ